MSYGTTDIGTLRFLAANVIYQATQGLLTSDDAEDRGILHDAVLMEDVISSYYTEMDPKFAKEIAAIREDQAKAKAKVGPGMELAPEIVESFRWRELKAMFRSLCRQGTFVRQEAPRTDWVPEVKA